MVLGKRAHEQGKDARKERKGARHCQETLRGMTKRSQRGMIVKEGKKQSAEARMGGNKPDYYQLRAILVKPMGG